MVALRVQTPSLRRVRTSPMFRVSSCPPHDLAPCRLLPAVLVTSPAAASSPWFLQAPQREQGRQSRPSTSTRESCRC